MKRKFLVFLLMVIIAFNLIGCAKCVSTEQENVEVTIVDEYYRGSYVTPIRAGKVTTMVTHPAVYIITVEYDDNEYTFTDSNTYYEYKDKVGQSVNATLETRTYDDGSVRYDIVLLD